MNEGIPEGYIRVSSILSIFQAYAHVDREKLRKAQETGTDIHAAIKSYFEDTFEPVEFRKFAYMESFLKWEQVVDLEPIVVEKRFFDENFMLTGQIDLLANLGGKPYLIDFKTGSWAHPEIWKLQGTFYRWLIKQHNYMGNDLPVPDKFLFVQLIKDGSAPILYEFDYDHNDWEVCMCAVRCYRYFNAPKTLGLDSNPPSRL